MGLDLSRLEKEFDWLNTAPNSRDQGATGYRIRLPEFPAGREFAWAELLLPRGFPDQATARIMLSQDAVLHIPHVEDSGAICIDGDPGPGRGYSAEDRIRLLLFAYKERFLDPWLSGQMDADFEEEPLNYWLIKVERHRSTHDPVRILWCVDKPPGHPTLREGLLLLPSRIVIAAGANEPITNRLVSSLGIMGAQRIRVRLADIPIEHPFTPFTWPRSASDIDRLINGRLGKMDRIEFQRPIRDRRRRVHRVVLLRNDKCRFAYLLPDGPATVIDNGTCRRAYPSQTIPLPLQVERVDPSWTVGRDQHQEVSHRQKQHVLVLGAGALGSVVVDHLAKAGVGFITLVDADILATANIGRHLLGVESVEKSKAEAVAQRINLAYPATVVTPEKISAERWLQKNSLTKVDLILDLTGEPKVRWHVNCARQEHCCPLLIGWMEPFVAAAHVCLLAFGTLWMTGTTDRMGELEAVTWPPDVIRQEPGCSSKFQSYTAAAAAFAVALVAENALKLIDGCVHASCVRSWVRGQRFLDANWQGLKLNKWAHEAAPYDGIVLERPFT